MKPYIFHLLIILLLSGFLSSCESSLSPQIETDSPIDRLQSQSNQIDETITISPSETPSRTPFPEIIIYSPLENIPLSDLFSIISNPFVMPHPRMDDGHQGIDLAFYRYNDVIGIEGLPIHSVLPGFVAAIVIDRNPYGNLVIIETPMEWLPIDWSNQIPLPEIAPTVVTDGRLTCPESGPSPTYDSSSRSIYLAYGHMQSPPQLNIGDQISGNQILGLVGNTGHSTNAHLHFETRIGPSHARFTSIAHKDGSATPEEMYNYCIWRISNLFELFDPMALLTLEIPQ